MLGTYIGSGPYWNEYLAKKHQPPPRMKQVIETHTPYEQFFHVTRLCTCATEHETRSMEARFIKKYNSTTGSNGYNTLKGHPAKTKQFWYLFRNNLLKPRQKSSRLQRTAKVLVV